MLFPQNVDNADRLTVRPHMLFPQNVYKQTTFFEEKGAEHQKVDDFLHQH